jgi:hypothetical protein
MKHIAVFCGSQSGNDELYSQHAIQLGRLLAQHGFTMVYGGGGRGLMGAVANGALEKNGEVIGIIPEHLRSWEAHHQQLEDLRIVPDMHTRKRMMFELSEAAIILPGGFGTMDELFELLTWNQLSLHDIPVYVLNTAGFYSDLFQMMQVMHRNGFLYHNLSEKVRVFDLPEKLMDYLLSVR